MPKLLVVTNEMPFPAMHGGRVDVLRRLQALHEQGGQVPLLVTWCAQGELGQGEAVAALKAQTGVAQVRVFEILRSWPARLRRLAGLLTQSLYVVTRAVPAGQIEALVLEARRAGVEAVMVDGLFAAPLGRRLAQRLGCPLIYRSHNVEFRYLKDQARLARGLRQRLAQWLAARGLESLERQTVMQADLMLDISVDDLAFWRTQGCTRGRWLPPYCPPLPRAPGKVPRTDLAFLGNLFMPNNVAGLGWFLQDVWPLVQQRRPGTTLTVAGSRPTPVVRQWCSEAAHVVLKADVASPAEVYDDARVMINPTRHGSGVNMKALELLETGKPVVSSPQGVKGLPPEHQALFLVATSADEFARLVAQALDEVAARPADTPVPSRLPPCYRPEAAADLLQWIQACLPTPVERP